jgi:hypothetical protein
MTQRLPVGSFIGMGACESIGSIKSCCDSCAHGGSCGKGLMGCGCKSGMGLFESGLDFGQWSGVEWTIAAVGGYMILSTFFTTQRVARRASDAAGRVKTRAKRIKAGFTK